jgi:tRNA nucleotidyltransferase/poly(A) polymerase
MVLETKYAGALWVMQQLEEAGYGARMAGGCVRDRCMNNEPHDFDIATEAHPAEVTEIFYKLKAKVIPTGIDHGTVTVLYKGVPYEVTTLRHDVATDGRHAVVEFGKSFLEDAARRDFTINALFEDRHGTIYDFFEGRKDIENRRLRFVGDPVKRIREDYLRILRFFRFWARFDYHPDPAALEAIRAEKNGLARISKERITSELTGLLAAAHAVSAVMGMAEAGVFDVLFPAVPYVIDTQKLDTLSNIDVEVRWVARLVCIFSEHLNEENTEEFLAAHLRLSNSQKNRVLNLVRLPLVLSQNKQINQSDGMDILDRVQKFWGAAHLMACLEAAAVVFPAYTEQILWLKELETKLSWLRKAPLPVTSIMLIDQLNIKAGPLVGRLLAELKAGFRNQTWTEPHEGIEQARKLLGTKEHDG